LDQTPRPDWPAGVRPRLEPGQPVAAEIGLPIERDSSWTCAGSEQAFALLFRERAALERIDPTLRRQAVMSFGADHAGRRRRVPVADGARRKAAINRP